MQNINLAMCAWCRCYHSPQAQCYGNPVYATDIARRQRTVESAALGENPYLIPVSVNGVMGQGLRDTGNNAIIMVDPRLINPQDYTSQIVYCRRTFDGPNAKQRLPIAMVRLSSVALNCENKMYVRVAVCNMSYGILVKW